MAEERKILIDVEVDDKDISSFDEEIGNVNKELERNKKIIQDLKKDYSSNSSEIAKLEAKNRDLSASKQQLIKASKTEAGSLDALRLKLASLTKERNSTNKSTEEGALKFAELQKEIKSTSDEIKGYEEGGGDFRRSVGNYPQQLGASIPLFARMKGQIVSLTTAAKAFIATPLGLILSAIALAISAVTAAFKDSEEGQNKFAKITGVIGVVLGNFRDILATIGEKIIETFENPGEAIENFKNLIVENITNRFQGLLELLPKLGEAISLLFEGEFAKAGQVAGDAVAKVALGIDNFSEKAVNGITQAKEAFSEFIDQNEREIDLAIQVADKRARADKLARQLLVDRARLEAEIAELRLKSRQEEEFTAQERKQALLDAQVLEDKLLGREREVLKLRADAISIENTFARSNKENLDAEAQAKAEVLRVEAARLNQQRATQRELNRVNKEIQRDDAISLKLQEDRLRKEREAGEALEIFRLEQQGKLEEAELKNREILLRNTELSENERQLIIEKSEKRIEKIRGDSLKASIVAKREEVNLRKSLELNAVNSFQGIFDQYSTIGKTAALTQIAYDTGQAISALVKNSEANPLNSVTFGGAGVLQFIAGLGRIGANIAKAKDIIKSKATGGGSISSGSSSSSSVPQSPASGPTSASLPGQLNFVNASLLSQFNNQARSDRQNNSDIVRGISRLPNPIVTVQDINTGQSRVAVKEAEATL